LKGLDKGVMKLLILGRGYVGSAMATLYPDCLSTRRTDFDLSKPDLWNESLLTLPKGSHVLWTFPAASTLEESEYAVMLFDRFFQYRKVILLGTTSCYQAPYEVDGWVTEKSPLQLDQIRTHTEEELRKRGACVLSLSGIFGPDRDPARWYERGLIKTGLSYLNLIHQADIASVAGRLFQSDRIKGERFNLSNGHPKLHQEIVAELQALGRLSQEISLPKKSKPGSKRVSHQKIVDWLEIEPDSLINYP
jgi:hypothetical protein